MKFWKRYIEGYNFERKMSFFLSIVIMGTATLILIVSTLSAVYSMTEKTRRMADEQLTTLASNYDDALEQHQTLAVAVVMNSAVQEYTANKYAGNGEWQGGEVYDMLLNILNMHTNINFAAVIKNDGYNYIYKGNMSVVDARFETVYEDDYEDAVPAKQGSTVHLSFNNHYFRDGSYTLTLYHPVYSTSQVLHEQGMLVINLNDNMLEQLYYRNNPSLDSEMFLMDINGRMVSVADQGKSGNVVPWLDKVSGSSGSFQYERQLVNYRKIGSWNYYMVNVIPLQELYRDSLQMMVILMLFIVIITIGAILVVRRMIKKFYQPVNNVVAVMDDVGAGALDVRIDTGIMDTDSRKLVYGFNTMMDKIGELMEQVKNEQHQIEQIRFNALQSQIQPHFLYNTLECIHWQALSDGNQEVSTLVKALAQYYRACLSKGKDIITLNKELEHIQAYLTIQNMRYDHIIDMTIEIPKTYDSVLIPKMTLQPLIENAIYHGIKIKEGKRGRVVLSITEEQADICILVADSGSGMSADAVQQMNQSISEHDDSFGYGVRNVNRRIELVFGKQYGLTFKVNGSGGVTVEIRLPAKPDISVREVM